MDSLFDTFGMEIDVAFHSIFRVRSFGNDKPEGNTSVTSTKDWGRS